MSQHASGYHTPYSYLMQLGEEEANNHPQSQCKKTRHVASSNYKTNDFKAALVYTTKIMLIIVTNILYNLKRPQAKIVTT